MRILLTNDDGPPDPTSSPYIDTFVEVLREAGHDLTIVVPESQASWIGKAHFVHTTTTARTQLVREFSTTNGGFVDREWILVNGTPATCAQIGLGYYNPVQDGAFGEGFDLVLSGPNYGRNSTAVLATSSGTIGGAMEGALCGKRAIALSFAFPLNRIHNPKHIKAACWASLKTIERLMSNWDPAAELYTVNVLLGHASLEKPGGAKVVFTNMLGNKWRAASCYHEITAPVVSAPQLIANGRTDINGKGVNGPKKLESMKNVRTFKWKHDMEEVHKQSDEHGPGCDGFDLREGNITVTGLKANFQHAELSASSARSFTV